MREYDINDVRQISGCSSRNYHRWSNAGFINGQPKLVGSGRPRSFTADQVVTMCALQDYATAVDATLDELAIVAKEVQKPRVQRWGGVLFFYRKQGKPVLVEQKSPFVPRPGEALVAVRNYLDEVWYK